MKRKKFVVPGQKCCFEVGKRLDRSAAARRLWDGEVSRTPYSVLLIFACGSLPPALQDAQLRSTPYIRAGYLVLRRGWAWHWLVQLSESDAAYPYYGL